MNREIKFRAWDKEEKKMHQIQKISFKTGKILPYGWNIEYSGADFELMQYIGLKDINNKEIYEGDYVKVFDVATGINSEGYVTFDRGSFYITDECYSRYRWIDYQVEVIGNIYENPEVI
jgi:uncharacterized phage protein (TIGR01671 family)